jgi:hypothetical protein
MAGMVPYLHMRTLAAHSAVTIALKSMPDAELDAAIHQTCDARKDVQVGSDEYDRMTDELADLLAERSLRRDVDGS